MTAAQLQALLNRAGAATPMLEVDGKIGPLTKAAIRAFQKRAGLRETGIPDDRLYQALQAALATPAPAIVAPPWLVLARAEKGQKEVKGAGSNGRILRYREVGMTTDDLRTEDGARPWCADFANAMLEAAGVRGTRSGMALSFKSSPEFVQLSGPALGAIVQFWRGTRTSGYGHVNFYEFETAEKIYGTGGNQGDAVTLAGFSRDDDRFGLLGYWWPASVPLPTIRALAKPAGATTADNVSMV